jgi:hypothetical protein
MVNLNQPVRITTTRVLLVAGVGALLLLHKQAQHHAALPSHPHVFSAQHGPDHIRRPPAPPVTMPPRVVEKVVERPVVVERVVEKVVERVVERPVETPAPTAQIPLPERRAAIAAWAKGEKQQWTRLEAIGVADRHATTPALCIDGFHDEPMCVPPFLQVRQPWRVWIVACHPSKGWRFNQLIHQGFDAHPALDRTYDRSEAHALVWIPTCMNSFSVDNWTKSECSKLAVLDESDNVGHWPQVRNTHFGLYFKRSWVHKRNGTHKVHHDVPHDLQHVDVKAARKDPHLHEICEGNGIHCKHHGHRAWKNRDHPDRGQYFAPLPYAVWDNYTHGLQLGSERDLRVVSTIRSSLKRQPARTRVVEFLKSILYEDMKLTEDEAVVGDTGGHRKTLDNSYFGLMRRAQIVVTCNPSFWDGDFRLFEALSSGALVFTDELHTPVPYPLVDGVHLVVYDHADRSDLERKLRYYLARPEEAARVAANGLAHVLRHHRAVSRVDYVLRSLADKWQAHPENDYGRWPRPPLRKAPYSETGFQIRASLDHELHALEFPPDPRRPLVG